MNDPKRLSHGFVIPAYGESPYLEECIQSLLKQTIPSSIQIVTSTPNEKIRELAERYGISLQTHEKLPGGIADDWNAAYRAMDADFVTIAHQDDTYEPTYGEKVVAALSKAENPQIAFTDYGELRNGTKVDANQLLNVKRKLLSPLRKTKRQSSRFWKRRVISLGNSISCPTVTYVKGALPPKPFTPGYRSNIDWLLWEELSGQNGAFVYVPEVLMHHRIHEGSATSEIIADHDRTKEDYDMLCRFWPKWVAFCIEHFYQKGENSNRT